MMQPIIRSLLFACLITIPLLGSSQVDYKLYQQLMQEYKNESIVELKNYTKYEINIVKGELEIFEINELKYIFLKDSPGATYTETEYVSDFTELVEFEANSYSLSGTKYNKIPVKDYAVKSSPGSHYFYDDSKELKFTFTGISVGSVVELKTVMKITEPRLISTGFLDSYYTSKGVTIEFDYDNNIKLDLLEKNIDSIKTKKTVSKNSKRSQITISLPDQKYAPFEDNTPGIRYYLPHVIPIIRSYTYKGESISILSDNASLYNWYYQFIKQSKEDIETDHLKKLADSLTANCRTDLCKVEELYYWVQENIKYIAFEDGMGGFIPRKPDDILKNRYGDCKDKSSLLNELANQVGINTYFTWIGTKDIPYTYSEVSSPVSDNHLIITYIDNDSIYHFLDGTARYNNIKFPTSFIQGKEAMIGINDSTFIIKTVPKVKAERNSVFDSVTVTIDSSVIKGTGCVTLTGYQNIMAKYGTNVSDTEELDEYMSVVLKKGNNKFNLEDYSIKDSKLFDTVNTIDYNFILENYMLHQGQEMYLNLNLCKDLLEFRVKKDRKFPVEFNFATKMQYKFKLIIPQGYEIESYPTSLSSKNDLLEFNIDYIKKDNYLVYEHSYTILGDFINNDQLAEWYKIINDLEKAYRQTVVIRKIKNESL